MRGAPAKGSGAGIQDAFAAGLAVAALLPLVSIMPNKEIPAQGRVLRSQRVKGGNIAICGQPGGVALLVIIARLEQDHLHARLGETCRYRATAGPGADDRIVTSDDIVGRHTT